MKKNKYMRIVLEDDLLFLKSLNGVGVVFNRVFREIFDEIRNCGTGIDGIATWNALVEGRIGIRIKLEGLSGSRSDESLDQLTDGSERMGPGPKKRREPTVLDNLMERVRDFDLGD